MNIYLKHIQDELDDNKKLKEYLKKMIDETDKNIESHWKEFDDLSKTLNLDNSISLNTRLATGNTMAHFRNMLMALYNRSYGQLDKLLFKRTSENE